jgi:DNA-binding HxlR family transcriptional regulator
MSSPRFNIGERSKLMFGNKNRMSVLRAALKFEVEPPEYFRAIDIMNAIKETGESILPSELSLAMANLENQGMVVRLPKENQGVYQRVEEPGWVIAEAVVSAIEAWATQ